MLGFNNTSILHVYYLLCLILNGLTIITEILYLTYDFHIGTNMCTDTHVEKGSIGIGK